MKLFYGLRVFCSRNGVFGSRVFFLTRLEGVFRSLLTSCSVPGIVFSVFGLVFLVAGSALRSRKSVFCSCTGKLRFECFSLLHYDGLYL